jgi:plasmid replication initiation protein
MNVKEIIKTEIDNLNSNQMNELYRLIQQWKTADSPPKHSILELRGLGKDIWQTVSVADYLNQERDAWNG